MKKDHLIDSNEWRINLRELSTRCFDSTLEIPANYRHFEELHLIMGDLGLFIYDYLYDHNGKFILSESLVKKYRCFLFRLREPPRAFNYAVICLNQGYFEASFREMRYFLESIVASIYEVDKEIIDAKYPLTDKEKECGISINSKLKNTLNFVLDNNDEKDKKSVVKFVNEYVAFHSKFVHYGDTKLKYAISRESGYETDLASELHGTPSHIYKCFNESLKCLIEVLIILTIYVYPKHFTSHVLANKNRLERLKLYPELMVFLLRISTNNKNQYLQLKKCLEE